MKKITELEIFLLFQKRRLKNGGEAFWQKIDRKKSYCALSGLKAKVLFSQSTEAELSDISSENSCVPLKSGEVKKT